MPTLSVYFASATSATLSTANQLYTVGGTPGAQENQVLIGTVSGWGEMISQGSAATWSGLGAIGAPTGHGFFLDDSSPLNNQMFSSGNWSAVIRSGLKTAGDSANVTFVLRAYNYRAGVYTNIVTMTSSAQAFSGSSAVTINMPSTAGTSGFTFLSGDKLYFDLWANVTTPATLGTQQLRYNNLSTDTTGHTGVATEVAVSPGYQAAPVTKVISTRLRLATFKSQTLGIRLRERVQRTKTLQIRFMMAGLTKTLQTRFNLSVASTLGSKTLQFRLRERIKATKTLAARLNLTTKISETLAIRFNLALPDAPLTLYGSTVASTTLSNACLLSNTTGGTSASNTTTCTDVSGTHFWYMEVLSRGGSNGDVATLPVPTGHGYLYDNILLENKTITSGNWNGAVRINDTSGFGSVDLIIRAYVYNAGVYTFIHSMTDAGVALTSTTTIYNLPNTAFPAQAFGVGDKLYLDFWVFANGAGGHWSGDPIVNFTSSNGTAGIASQFAVVTPVVTRTVFSASKTQVTRTRIATQVTKTLGTRLRLRSIRTKTLAFRFVYQPLRITKTILSRLRLATQQTKTLAFRFRERDITTRTLVFRFIYQPLNITKTILTRFRLVTPRSRTLAFRLRESTAVSKTLALRLRMYQNVQTLQIRFITHVLVTQTLLMRLRITTRVVDTLLFRLILQTIRTRTLQLRFRLVYGRGTRTQAVRARIRSKKTSTMQFRVRTAGSRLLSGGVGLYASGTGTVSFDTFRATQWPDPAIRLANTGRIASSLTQWESTTPLNTTLALWTSFDGVNWSPATSGGVVPGFYAQPYPQIDIFTADTSTAYTSTFRSGGGAATIAYDITNSRILLTGGTNAVYLFTAIDRDDVDFFCTCDRADAGGLAFRYNDANNFYYLQVGDGSSSVATNTFILQKVLANTRTTLATASISFPRGTYKTIRVTMILGVITAYLDGNVVLTYTDPSPLGSGLMGFYNTGGSARYYQLRLQPLGDDLTGTYLYTKAAMTTSVPIATPQVTELLVTTRGPGLDPGVIIPQLHPTGIPFAEYYHNDFASLVTSSANENTDYYWSVDLNGVLTFSSRTATAAPWCLTTADLLYTPIVKPTFSADLYRNRHTVTNCIGTTAPTTEIKIADGSTTSWMLAYPVNEAPTITIEGVIQTVGVQGTDVGKAFYWQSGSTSIGYDPSLPPIVSGYAIKIVYIGQFKTSVSGDNIPEQLARAKVEVGTSGIVEVWEDMGTAATPMTAASAAVYIQGVLAKYSNNNAVMIQITTLRAGLDVGQLVSVFIPEFGLNNVQLFITKIVITGQQQGDGSVLYQYDIQATNGPSLNNWSDAFIG